MAVLANSSYITVSIFMLYMPSKESSSLVTPEPVVTHPSGTSIDEVSGTCQFSNPLLGMAGHCAEAGTDAAIHNTNAAKMSFGNLKVECVVMEVCFGCNTINLMNPFFHRNNCTAH